jgi:hypothetical protein
LQKVHVENFFQKNRQHFRCQFFLDSILFYRVFGCFSAMGGQKHHKNVLQKKSCRKVLQKNRQKIENRFFS